MNDSQSKVALKRVLIPLPAWDFDPTEVAIPFQIIKHHDVTFATPEGQKASADIRMLDGNSLGMFRGLFMANEEAIKAYRDLENSSRFNKPISYSAIKPNDYDAILLPGGHAPGMKVYLESKKIQEVVKKMMEANKPIAAICHGVLVCARSGVIKDKKVTALPRQSELLAWRLTRKKLGNYYRTYSETTVEDEVKASLSDPKNFIPGPPTLIRDHLKRLWPGFVIRDENLLTARWPGDAHNFALEFLKMLRES